MANLFKSIESGALAWLMQVEGVSVTVAGETHRALEGNATSRNTPQDGGFLADFDVIYTVLKSDWTTLPAIGAQLTTNSVTYRIENIVTSQNDPGMVLACIGVNK